MWTARSEAAALTCCRRRGGGAGGERGVGVARVGRGRRHPASRDAAHAERTRGADGGRVGGARRNPIARGARGARAQDARREGRRVARRAHWKKGEGEGGSEFRRSQKKRPMS